MAAGQAVRGSEVPASASHRPDAARSRPASARPLAAQPEMVRKGYFQLGVEVYGGALLNPWFDRDLSLAGRVSYRASNGSLGNVLIDYERAIACVPSLAIHLDREANKNRTINHLAVSQFQGGTQIFSIFHNLCQNLMPRSSATLFFFLIRLDNGWLVWEAAATRWTLASAAFIFNCFFFNF